MRLEGVSVSRPLIPSMLPSPLTLDTNSIDNSLSLMFMLTT